MGKIFANDATDKRLNFQNIQTVHTTQYKKTKMSRRLE